MFKMNSIIFILSLVIFEAHSQLYESPSHAGNSFSFIDDNRLQQNNNNLNHGIDYAKNVKLNRRIYAMCPPNFVNVGNECYSLIEEKNSWLEAHFFCKDKNSKLAEPQKNSDPRLRKFLQNYDRHKDDPIWIGATYDWQNNVWQWSISGKNLSYNNFAINTDTDKVILENHCAVFDPQLNYGWSARSCPDKHRFICQHKMPRVSEKNRFRVYDRWNRTFPHQLANEYVYNVRNGTRFDRRIRPTQKTEISRSTDLPNDNDVGLLRLHPNDINTDIINVPSTTELPPTMISRKGGRRSRKRTEVDRKLQKQRDRERRRLQRKRERQQKLQQEKQQRRQEKEEQRRRADEERRRAEEYHRAAEEQRRAEEDRQLAEEQHKALENQRRVENEQRRLAEERQNDEARRDNHEIGQLSKLPTKAELEKEREQEERKRRYEDEVEARQKDEKIRRDEETKAKQIQLEKLNEQNRLQQQQLEKQRAEELKRQQENEERELELQRERNAKRLEQEERERLEEENHKREQKQREREEEIEKRKREEEAIKQEEERIRADTEQEEKQRQQELKEKLELEERLNEERAEAEKQQKLAEEKAKNERLAEIAKEEAERVRKIDEKRKNSYAQRIANLSPESQKAFFEERRRRKHIKDKQRQKKLKYINDANDINEAYLNKSRD